MPHVILHKVSHLWWFYRVVSSKENVMPLNFFQQSLQLNVVGYTEMLETAVKPWIDSVCNRCLYVFQQDSAAVHKAVVT